MLAIRRQHHFPPFLLRLACSAFRLGCVSGAIFISDRSAKGQRHPHLHLIFSQLLLLPHNSLNININFVIYFLLFSLFPHLSLVTVCIPFFFKLLFQFIFPITLLSAISLSQNFFVTFFSIVVVPFPSQSLSHFAPCQHQVLQPSYIIYLSFHSYARHSLFTCTCPSLLSSELKGTDRPPPNDYQQPDEETSPEDWTASRSTN